MSTHLYVKGSNIHGEAKRRLGDCIKCQRVLLVMRLKDVDFEIHYIDERTKQIDESYKKLYSTMTPVLVIHDVEYQDADDIVAYLELESHKFGWSLKSNNVVANALASKTTPISSLVGWIKNTDPSRDKALFTKLYKTLDEIDQILGSYEGDFLDGNEIKLPDCILLPKLYHAKVAAKCARDYDFTMEFKNIRRYLDAAQKNKVFKETCPDESEICEKWKNYRK